MIQINHHDKCFEELNEYMFSGKNLVKYLKNENLNTSEKIDTTKYREQKKENYKNEKVRKTDSTDKMENLINQKETLKNEDDNIFIPKEKDQLFWCYFVMKNGFSTYEHPNTTSFENEKMIKIKSIDDLRLHKQQLKNKNLKNIKEICEDELVNKSQISLKTFTALCVIANMNFLYIENRKCFPCICEEDESINIIYKKGNYYICDMDISKEKMRETMKNYFIVENIEKPLKSISSYKSQELMDLCGKLGVVLETGKEGGKEKKITKPVMYEKLVQYLS